MLIIKSPTDNFYFQKHEIFFAGSTTVSFRYHRNSFQCCNTLIAISILKLIEYIFPTLDVFGFKLMDTSSLVNYSRNKKALQFSELSFRNEYDYFIGQVFS